jgi:hypothetical protein
MEPSWLEKETEVLEKGQLALYLDCKAKDLRGKTEGAREDKRQAAVLLNFLTTRTNGRSDKTSLV